MQGRDSAGDRGDIGVDRECREVLVKRAPAKASSRTNSDDPNELPAVLCVTSSVYFGQ
jgi:hypothetical protein